MLLANGAATLSMVLHVCLARSAAVARLLILGLSVCMPTGPAAAVVAEPSPVDTPVPEEWRGPLAHFLGELGVTDIQSTINASRAAKYPRINEAAGPILIFFRIVHPYACNSAENVCLTVIGSIKDGIFKPEVMFYAGEKINVGDVAPRIIGAKSFPVFFHGKTSAVGVVETTKGFLVIPQP